MIYFSLLHTPSLRAYSLQCPICIRKRATVKSRTALPDFTVFKTALLSEQRAFPAFSIIIYPRLNSLPRSLIILRKAVGVKPICIN